MFVLGHLGFGSLLARPWRDRLGRLALFAGMLLPDLIDKPLYYARLSDVFSCTRTIGHTGLLTLAVLTVGLLARRRAAVAVALGMTTHLVLDCAMDLALGNPDRAAIRAAAWPLLGTSFAQSYLPSIVVHVERLVNWPIFITEAMGAGLLAWDWMTRRGRRSGRRAPI